LLAKVGAGLTNRRKSGSHMEPSRLHPPRHLGL
jgi:hypothetical protein